MPVVIIPDTDVKVNFLQDMTEHLVDTRISLLGINLLLAKLLSPKNPHGKPIPVLHLPPSFARPASPPRPVVFPPQSGAKRAQAVVRKDIENMHVAVYPPDRRVRISTPLLVDDYAVRLAAISKLSWIRRKQDGNLIR